MNSHWRVELKKRLQTVWDKDGKDVHPDAVSRLVLQHADTETAGTEQIGSSLSGDRKARLKHSVEE